MRSSEMVTWCVSSAQLKTAVCRVMQTGGLAGHMEQSGWVASIQICMI